MTPKEAASILEAWGARAKTEETREVCDMASMGMRNSALARDILAREATGEVIIHVIKDGPGEWFVARTHGHTVGAQTLNDALTGLLDKVSK